LAKAESSIPTVRVGSLQWDQIEMTIGEVKRFTSQTGFVSQAEKNGGGTAVDTIVLGGGRASVVEADRKVVGNLITIHTNPKHFEAQGNVKTRFLSKRAGPSSPPPAASAPTASKNKAKQSPAALNLRLPNTTEEEEFNPQAFSAPNAHQRKHGRPS
jgi:hypothetical protein